MATYIPPVLAPISKFTLFRSSVVDVLNAIKLDRVLTDDDKNSQSSSAIAFGRRRSDGKHVAVKAFVVSYKEDGDYGQETERMLYEQTVYAYLANYVPSRMKQHFVGFIAAGYSVDVNVAAGYNVDVASSLCSSHTRTLAPGERDSAGHVRTFRGDDVAAPKATAKRRSRKASARCRRPLILDEDRMRSLMLGPNNMEWSDALVRTQFAESTLKASKANDKRPAMDGRAVGVAITVTSLTPGSVSLNTACDDLSAQLQDEDTYEFAVNGLRSLFAQALIALFVASRLGVEHHDMHGNNVLVAPAGPDAPPLAVVLPSGLRLSVPRAIVGTVTLFDWDTASCAGCGPNKGLNDRLRRNDAAIAASATWRTGVVSTARDIASPSLIKHCNALQGKQNVRRHVPSPTIMELPSHAAENDLVILHPPRDTLNVAHVDVVEHPRPHRRPNQLDLTDTCTSPTNQGGCGSCWAITATQCLRDRLIRARPKTAPPVPPLSYYLLTKCAQNCISYEGRKGCPLSCNGGFLISGFRFLQAVGTTRNAYFPNPHSHESGIGHLDQISHNQSMSCPRSVPRNEPLYRCQGFYHLHLYPELFGITNARLHPPPRSAEEMRRNADNIAEEIYLNGPVAVCFNLFSDFKKFWQHPNSKDLVYEIGWELPPATRATINPVGDVRWTKRSGPYGIFFKTGHSVSLVGYGTQRDPATGEQVDYWICRNSWGRPSNTYHGGFFKMRRGINSSAIEADVAAPRVDAKVASGYNVPLTAAAAALPALTSPQAPASGRVVVIVSRRHNEGDGAVRGTTLAAVVFFLFVVVCLLCLRLASLRARPSMLYGADGLWRN